MPAKVKSVSGRHSKGAIPIFKRFFNKKKQNTQPENARIARRAVKLAKLAETNNVSLSGEDAAGLAERFAKIPDAELDKISAGVSPIVGCPANVIPIFAGYSGYCTSCPYFSKENKKQNGCVLKEN